MSDSLRCTCLGCGGEGGAVEVTQDAQSGPFLRVGGAEWAQLPLLSSSVVACGVVANCLPPPDWSAAAVFGLGRYHEGVGRK